MAKKRVFTGEEKQLCWDLWRRGLGFSDIAKELDSKPGTIFGIIRITGGYPPGYRTRNLRHLSLGEREEISRGIVQGKSIRSIAISLDRSPSTISREISKNGGIQRYRAFAADQIAWKKALRPKECKLSIHPELCKIVANKLLLKWSPEQIAGWLNREYPGIPNLNISHETIYKSLYMQSRNVLAKKLMRNLRRGRKMRHTLRHTTKGDRGSINTVNGRSIHSRGRNIEERTSVGHWEGDLISGSRNSHIATLVERKTRYTIMAYLEGKDTDSVISALNRELLKLPGSMRKSLTWDRGMELANHRFLTQKTKMEVYFCDPKSPWQRGLNENTNGLIRQYFPRKTPLGHYQQKDLDSVSKELNGRPRKILDYQTPEEVLYSSVAITT